MNKYGAIKTEIDGIIFDSRKESRRYSELKLLEYKGDITELELQPKYPCVVNGKKVCVYVADFRYVENGQTVVEDAKSEATRKNSAYRIKKKLTEAIYNIAIVEV